MDDKLKTEIQKLIGEEKYDGVIKLCEPHIKDNVSEVYFYSGLVSYNLKKYSKSIEYYSEAIKANPNYSDAYFNRGLSKFFLKKFKEAIEDYNEAINKDPNDYNAYFNRGIAHFYLRNYGEAIKNYNEFIKNYKEDIGKNPNYGNAYFYRGIANSHLGNYEDAIKDYEEAIKQNTNVEDAYFNIGLSYLKLKKYKEALNNYNENKIKDNIAAYLFRAICNVFLLKDNFKFDLKYFRKSTKYNNIYIITILELFEKYDNIEDLFSFLVNINNNELWQNEPITNLISSFDENKKINGDIQNNIKYLLLYEYFLLKLLTFDTEYENNNDNDIEISHYTSLDVLYLLLNSKENSKESGNIRINNITTANDPKEGKMLQKIFNKNNIDIKIKNNDEKPLTLQTSYSRNKDHLTMFRLYGKKENKEATGVCLVLDNQYFNNSYTSPYSYKIEMNEKTNKEKLPKNKRNLYWMLYYNEKENKIIYNKEKSKYLSNIIDLNDLKDHSYKAELKADSTKEDMIKYAFTKIFYYTGKIKEKIEGNGDYKNIKNKLYSCLFENIKYIIKHDAFFEEHELRMLVTNDYKSDEILLDNHNKKLYIDYIKLFDKKNNYIKEIIIAPKVENGEAVAEYIKKLLHSKNTEANGLDNIKVSILEAPFR